MRSDVSVLLLCLAACLSGCAATRTVLEDSAVDTFADDDAELDFWDDLATRRVVTNNDALHGLLLVADDEDAAEDYETRAATARLRGWMNAESTPPADESANVGMIAVAVCDILDIQGGVTMRLLGPSPRYCTREIVYRELVSRRTENQSLSGLEFVDLIGRMEDETTRSVMED